MNNTSPSPYQYRQSQLAVTMQTGGLSALILNPGPSLFYLTGLSFHLMERPVVALFSPHTPSILVLPELEAAKVTHLPFPAQIFTYGEDPEGWAAVFNQGLKAASLAFGSRIGVEPRRFRLLELRLVEGALPDMYFISAEDVMATLRMHKDESELAAMRKAVQIAQRALLETLPLIKVGTTEKEIAAELTLQLLRGGSEPEMPFSPIVSTGPNSANPHATPSNRALQPGDCLVIDWGATCDGYISDITRTFAVVEADNKMQNIAQIVAQANTAGRAIAGPGVTAEQVDQAARQVIANAGYSQYFIHRTGHGIGLEGHEEPYIRSGNQLQLSPGMTFTVEPGIYIPDRNGVRIEDNIVVIESGSESLTDLPRELTIVG
jgi:Xaa-Pro dipeptidase